MKLILKIIFFIFTGFSSSATFSAPKIVVPTNTSFFQKTEKMSHSEKAKIGKENFAEECNMDAGSQIVVPAYQLLLFQQSIENDVFYDSWKTIVNIGATTLAVLTAPLTLGGSLYAVGAVTLSVMNENIEAERNNALSSEQYLYDNWRNFYSVVGMLEGGYGVVRIIPNLPHFILSTKDLIVNIKNLPTNSSNFWKGIKSLFSVSGAGSFVPSSLITKLTQQGATKLKAWTSVKSLSFVDDAGNVLTGANAETKIFQKLDDVIGNQNVLGTFEDAQGRLLVQCEGSNRNTVYGVLTNKNGQQVVYKFEPAYKPSANPSIPVPLSANKLAPDFAGTQYLYPIAGLEKNIVKIKLTGNRTSDFVKSNQAAGLGNSATTPSRIINGVEVKYTWHHLDDFDPITGECTMQLVETSAHSTVGMTHTGSVGQYKSFNGSEY